LKRIDDLDRISQDIIKFGAIFLKDFNYDLMQQLTGLDNTELSKALWELKRRQVLVEENNRYRFYHATLREAINKRIAYPAKRDMYYQVGKTLELIYKRNTDRVVEDLAYYFINAKDRKKGIMYGLRAAKKSSGRYVNEQAIRFYKGVLSLLDKRISKRRFDILQRLAEIETRVGFYDDAIVNYNRALSLKMGETEAKIEICAKIGYVYEIKGEYNKALHSYQRAAKFLNKIRSNRLRKPLEIFLNVKICRAHQMSGDYKKTTKFSFDNLQFLKDSKEKNVLRLRSRIYHTIGLIEFQKRYYGKEQFDEAIYYYKKAYKCYSKLENKNRTAAVLTNLGLCYYWKRKLKKAFDCFQKSYRISEKTGAHYSIMVNLIDIGLVFYHKGEFLKALSYLEKTLSMSQKFGNLLVMSESLWGISICYFSLCNYKKSKECLEKIARICERAGFEIRKISAILNIGSVHQAIGDYSSALRLYNKGLKISRNYQEQYLRTVAFVNIGSVFIDLGQFSKAKRYLNKALKKAHVLRSKQHTIKCYLMLSRLNLMMEDYLGSLSYYEKGIRIAEKLGIKLEILSFSLLGSKIYYHEKKYSKGVKNADRAIKLGKEMGTKDLYAEALLMKVKNGIKQGVLSRIEIIKILDEAKGIAEDIGCPEVLWKVYFAYGRFFQDDNQYFKALDYYEMCNKIFGEVASKIKNVSHKKSYLHHPDRQAVITAVYEIEGLSD